MSSVLLPHIRMRVLVIWTVMVWMGGVAVTRAATFTINSTADVVDAAPGDGKCDTGRTPPPAAPECTLRAAVQEANALAGGSTIMLPAGTYLLTQPVPCSFRVQGNPNLLNATTSSLCLAGQVTIVGAGNSSTLIDANKQDRVMFVSADAKVQIGGVAIQHGRQQGGSFNGGGGGVNNQGTLTVTDSLITANVAEVGAGGFYNAGALTLINSSVTGNTAIPNLGDGGGIFNNGGTATISNTTFSSNTAGNGGGGIAIFQGTVTVSGSTFTGNTSTAGASVRNYIGTVIITNSTMIGNSAFVTGGVQSDDTAVLNNVTIVQNRSQRAGGGVHNVGSMTLRNSLIAGNSSEEFGDAPDCSAPGSSRVFSQGHNLIQNTTGCLMNGDTLTNITGKDPRIGVLASNGGPTPTIALLADSPAINAGDPAAPGSGGTACAAADQRGVLRPQNSACDIGAFERERGFTVFGVQPNHGGNGGSIIATVSGSGFNGSTTVVLRRSGQPDIAGALAAAETGGASLSASFDLTGRLTGAWDLVVNNPGSTSITLPAAFTVDASSDPKVFAEIIGRSAVRAGVPAQYAIVYGNRGNVDAVAVPLTLSTPGNFKLNVYFSITPPPPQPGQAISDWSLVPVDVLPDAPSGFTNVLFLLPVIPAGYTGSLRFSLTLPANVQHGSTFTLVAHIEDPYFQPDLDPGIVQGFVAAARNYAQKNLGVTIPSTLTPNLTQYVAAQLQTLAALGRNDLLASLETQQNVYSLAQLTIDTAVYGAARTTSSKQISDAAIGSPLAVRAAGSSGKPNPCDGQVLAAGQSCGDNPNPIPPPDDPKKPRKFTKDDCSKELHHHVSADGSACVPDDKKGCPIFPNPFIPSDPNCASYPITDSVDPNDKAGPPGVKDSHFRVGGAPFTYTIFFENLAAATAPAQDVIIVDQLDTSRLDLSTFSLGPITFGAYTVPPPPGQTQHVAGLDLRPSQNVTVKIDARLDPNTGIATWHFISLDPATQQRTTDALAGFLPPNVNPPAGEGHVTFTIMPKAGTASGTTICNQATVTFDVNAPINTPRWCSTLDDMKPVSHVLPLPATQATPSFTVRWSGTDAGSGILNYTIYVSDNGGPFTVWLSQTSDTQATYAGAAGHTYRFFSTARDLVGNVEDVKNAAEAITTIGGEPMCAQDVTSQFKVIPGGFRFNNGTQRFVQTVTLQQLTLTPIQLPLALVLDNLSSNATLFNKTGNTTCAVPLGSPYINVPTGSTSVILDFADPTKTGITYNTRVLMGSGTR